MESIVTELAWIVQLPSPLLVPSLKVQPEGTPAITTVTEPTWPAGSERPRFIGLPETPAGRIWLGIIAVRLDNVTPAKSTKMSFAAFGEVPTCSKTYVWAVPPIFATNATVA